MYKAFHLLIIFFLILAVFPLFVSAGGFVPCGGEGEPQCNFQHLITLIIRVINYLISVAAIVAMYQILLAAWNLMTSLGNPDKIQKAKTGISNAVVGFGIVVLAFVMVNLLANGIFGKRGTERPWWDPKCIYSIGPQEECPFGISEPKAVNSSP